VEAKQQQQSQQQQSPTPQQLSNNIKQEEEGIFQESITASAQTVIPKKRRTNAYGK